MDDVIVREVRGEELLATAFPLRAYAFDGRPSAAEPAHWIDHLPLLASCLVLVLFERGVPLATATSIPLTQSVSGTLLPGAGVSFVATHPAARRRGLQTRVIGRLLETMRERGEAVAALHPSRESFYARFGFVGFPNAAIARIDPARLALLVRRALPGRVEVTPFREGFGAYRAFLTEIQPRLHGFALVDPTVATGWFDRADKWLAFAWVDGEIMGAMTYTLSHFGELAVDEFVAAPGAARYLLLQWLGHHAEQVTAISVVLPPTDRLETWLLDLRASIGLPDPLARLTPMARIVSFDAIDGLRVGPGRFTARIVDQWCPWNEGAFELSSEDGRLCVSRVADADCALTSQAISSLVYGGDDPDDFAIRGWGEPPAATRAAMRSMFPSALPFLYERF